MLALGTGCRVDAVTRGVLSSQATAAQVFQVTLNQNQGGSPSECLPVLARYLPAQVGQQCGLVLAEFRP